MIVFDSVCAELQDKINYLWGRGSSAVHDNDNDNHNDDNDMVSQISCSSFAAGAASNCSQMGTRVRDTDSLSERKILPYTAPPPAPGPSVSQRRRKSS